MNNKRRLVSTLLSIVAATALSLPVHACAFDSQPYFTYSTHPDLPLDKYSRGELGILQPTFARSYLFVAYRYLSNQPLTAVEQKQALDLWNSRLTASDYSCDADTSGWLKARAEVPGTTKIEQIDTSRPINDKDSWETYCNCQTPAFNAAAKQLKELVTKYGASSEPVKEWVKAQDEVFSNCGTRPYSNEKKPTVIPTPLPANADPFLQKLRNYQIAAANFYTQNFEAARTEFDAIAADQQSPWKQIAGYLAARCLIREATLFGTNAEALLTQAKAKIASMLADPANANLSEDLQALGGFVQARLNPATYVLDLVDGVVPVRNVGSITFALDTLLENKDTNTKMLDELSRNEAVDWVLTFQDTSDKAKKHAVAKWKETKSIPWLVNAIVSVDSDDADAPALMAAARSAETSSAAAKWTLFYQANRIEMGRAQRDSALRTRLDKVIASPPADLSKGSLNALRTQRLELARNLDEFVEFGVQTPLSICSNGGVQEVPDDIDAMMREEKLSTPPPSREFTAYAGEALDNQMPLSVLTQLAAVKPLPTDLRNNVAWTSWVRAVLIGDDGAARKLAQIAKPLNSKKSAMFDAYLAAGDPAARKFAASFLMMHFSSAIPNAQWGPLLEDSYGDASGWWWGDKPIAGTLQFGMGDSDANTVQPIDLPFLTDAQKAQAKAELARLEKVKAAPNYFAAVVLPFAKSHPADPRVPEALHWFVKATRYGSTDDATKKYSKEAFTLLHSKYKNSVWAKKTPYYY